MALVTLPSISAATHALIRLHNVKYRDKNLRITFSHPKKSPNHTGSTAAAAASSSSAVDSKSSGSSAPATSSSSSSSLVSSGPVATPTPAVSVTASSPTKTNG